MSGNLHTMDGHTILLNHAHANIFIFMETKYEAIKIWIHEFWTSLFAV